MNPINAYLGKSLGRYLTQKTQTGVIGKPTPISALRQTLIAGDVLLIEGNLRISQIIKYLTQSSWSHTAIYIGENLNPNPHGVPLPFIEADLIEGVRACPFSEYTQYPSRICRAHRLDERDRAVLIGYLKSQLGRQYDLRHVFDLARYLFPIPIPARFRRRMMELGSGDPTKAFCSSLIAEAFNKIGYPILPLHDYQIDDPQNLREALRIGVDDDSHERLFNDPEARALRARPPKHIVPRDFDVSPYFQIIKPTLEMGFDYRDYQWSRPAH